MRFRHTGGDVGPFRFPASSNVQDMRERLFQEWPKGERGGRSCVALRLNRPRHNGRWADRSADGSRGSQLWDEAGTTRAHRGFPPPPSIIERFPSITLDTDGSLGKDYPASPGEVRIILNGRFLDAGESLQGGCSREWAISNRIALLW